MRFRLIYENLRYFTPTPTTMPYREPLWRKPYLRDVETAGHDDLYLQEAAAGNLGFSTGEGRGRGRGRM